MVAFATMNIEHSPHRFYEPKKKLSTPLDINNTNINLEYHFSKNTFIRRSCRGKEEFF